MSNRQDIFLIHFLLKCIFKIKIILKMYRALFVEHTHSANIRPLKFYRLNDMIIIHPTSSSEISQNFNIVNLFYKTEHISVLISLKNLLFGGFRHLDQKYQFFKSIDSSYFALFTQLAITTTYWVVHSPHIK